MKKYCYIKDNIVITIEPEFIDIFPDIPIEERYSKEFLENCIAVDEDVEVQTGMIYEDDIFEFPPEPELEEPIIIDDEIDEEKIVMAEAIIDLENRLSELEGGK